MQKHFFRTILVSALGLAFPAFSLANGGGMDGGGMMGSCMMGFGMITGGWFGFGIWGWSMMVLLWILVILGVVFLVKWALEQGKKG